MVTTVFGPSFSRELAIAGLAGLPISWTDDGNILGRDNLDPGQQALLDAVIAAHDPAAPTPEMVDAVRDARLAAGFDDAETGKVYQCDPASVTNWTALTSAAGFALSLGAAPLPTYTLITFDNSPIELGAEELFALMTERVMPWVSATYFYARSLKDQVLAGTPPDDINTGWP